MYYNTSYPNAIRRNAPTNYGKLPASVDEKLREFGIGEFEKKILLVCGGLFILYMHKRAQDAIDGKSKKK